MVDVARSRDRCGLPVTVDDPEALHLYDDAVEAFTAGDRCLHLVERCLARRPGFALALACQAAIVGRAPSTGWPPATAGLTRRERQHLDIVAAAVAGRLDRASGLAAEHLVEYPGDRLITTLMTDLITAPRLLPPVA